MQVSPKISDELFELTARAIRDEPVLKSLGSDREVTIAIPQRVMRRPFKSDEDAPPLFRMLDHARRGSADVRIRLYLWLLAITDARPPAPYRRTSGNWALLLNLLEDNHRVRRGQAARRVSNAIDFLEEAKLVRRVDRDTVRLLDPDGSGADYIPATDEAIARDREIRADQVRRFNIDVRRSPWWEDPPIRVPVAWWLNGTVSVLSGPGLASLLVLMAHDEREERVIWVPKSRLWQYRVRHDTWWAGLAELERFKLVTRVAGETVIKPGVNSLAPKGRNRVGWVLNERSLFKRPVPLTKPLLP